MRILEKFSTQNPNQESHPTAHSSLERCTQFYKSIDMNYPKFYKMDLMCKWGIIASELLLKPFTPQAISPYQKVIILSNTQSSLHTDIQFQHTIHNELPSPSIFVYTLPNIIAGEIAIRYEMKGENSFFIQNKFNPNLIYNQTEQLFLERKAKQALCGFIDVCEEKTDILFCLITKQKSDIEFSKENLNQLYVEV